MMIPLHYFLLLFVLLASLTGCSQHAPPGSDISNKKSDQLTTGSVVETKVPNVVVPLTAPVLPVIKPTEKPVEKPVLTQENPLATSFDFSLTSPNAREWLITVRNKDAKTLYQLLEVQASEQINNEGVKVLVKTGERISCSKANADSENENFSCELNLGAATGLLVQKLAINQIKKTPAELILTEKYQSLYFDIDFPTVNKDGVTEKIARLFIGDSQESGSKIYREMTAKSAPLVDVVDGKNNIIEKQRSEKKGEHVKCTEGILVKNNKPTYFCTFYFDYNTGAFDKIL